MCLATALPSLSMPGMVLPECAACMGFLRLAESSCRQHDSTGHACALQACFAT